MFLYLLPLITLCFVGYKLDLYTTIKVKYNRFKKLNSLVRSRYKTNLKIIYISLCLILKVLYLNFWNYLNPTVIQLSNNIYEIQYVIEGRLYKMLIEPKRGPCNILQIIEE